MRKLDPEFQARLESGATKLCRAWRVVRKDGKELGFTDHDQDLAFDGTVFKASSGLDAGALQTSTGLSVDNGVAVGALNNDSITDEDIQRGKFDGAHVCQWLVDWERPDLREVLFRGTFGEIRRSDNRFEVELRGLAEALNAPVGRTILRKCDRVLGDGKCNVKTDQMKFSAKSKVATGSSGATIIVTDLAKEDYDSSWFSDGQIRWLTGENEGERSVIKSDTWSYDKKRVIVLWELPPAEFAVGDDFEITAGCDKQVSTCAGKFNNILNFRGFPHIPGDDWVLAYPKDGAIHDGGSQQ